MTLRSGRLLAVLILFASLSVQASDDCGGLPARATDLIAGPVAPAEGFEVRPLSLLPAAHDARFALDRVLRRQTLEGCLATLLAPPATQAATALVSADGYVPKTPFDNTPHRFDMQQGGKRMTASDFDAWMQARGYRVSKGKAQAAAETASQ